MISMPPVIAGRYRVLQELGRGGMGAVYLVEHVHTGEQFALKVLLAHTGATPELVERFKREARAPARIKSDHVAKVIDADVSPELEGAPFLVMELLDGSNLESHVEESGPLSAEETITILRQLAVALDKAHAIGIVHRDLKPENVFLHRREQHRVVKLLDFGISKLTDEGGGDINSAALTRTGMTMGTPLFMSPEQARGETKITYATDVWALGLIAFRMLAKVSYWDAQTIAVLMSQILVMPMALPSSRAPSILSASFDGWFLRSCDRDPAARFRSVGEQIEALAAALSQPFALPLARAPLQGTAPPATPRMPHAPPLPASTDAVMGVAHTKLGAGVVPMTAPAWPKRMAGGAAVLVALLGVALGARAALHRSGASASATGGGVGLTAAAPSEAAADAPSKVAVAVAVAATTLPVSVEPPVMPTTAAPTTPAPAPAPRAKISGARERASDADAGTGVGAGAAAEPKAVSKPARPTTPAGTYAPTAL